MPSLGTPPHERTFPLTAREAAVVAVFWALFAVFRVADLVLMEPNLPAAARHLLPTGAESLGWIACTPLVVALVEWCVVRRRGVAFQAGLYAGGGLLAALTVSAVGTWLRVSTWVRPPFATGPLRPLSPPYWFWFGDAFATYLGVLGAALTRAYVLRYRTQREERALLEARLTASRLEALRRQLDPHFLFNTLSLVASLVERDPPGARRMIARLSDLLRASLADGGDVEIPLHQELTLIGVYLDIMRMRFAGRLETETHVDPGLRDALVPPLVLQPLVENAVKHGVEHSRGPARITIDVAQEGGALTLRVRDTGSGAARDAAEDPDARVGGGIGLLNTRARLGQLYGRGAGLTMRPAAGGTEVEVRLPLRVRPGAPAEPDAPPRPTAAAAGAYA